MSKTYPIDEWRVIVKIPAGTGWSQVDTWFDACFPNEPSAKAYAERFGGTVYLQHWVAPGVKGDGLLL